MTPSDQQEAAAIAAAVVAERQWPAVVKLKHPVTFAGETISSLEFRRGKMGDLRGMMPGEVPPFEQIALVASRMCGRPLNVIFELDSDDSGEVVVIVMGFLGRSLVAGKTP